MLTDILVVLPKDGDDCRGRYQKTQLCRVHSKSQIEEHTRNLLKLSFTALSYFSYIVICFPLCLSVEPFNVSRQ